MSSRSPRDDRPDRIARFEGALRAWAARPPRTPTEEAARWIGERLPERSAPSRFPAARPTVRPALALAAALFVLAAGLAVWLGPAALDRGPLVRPPQAGAAPPPEARVAPAGDVLVIELDPETTLYMTLGDQS